MEFFLNFNSWFKGLPASGKLSLFFVLAGVVVAGLLLKSHYDTAGYQYLYTNLTLTDANAVAERLQSMNVKAKIQGDAVLVPGNRVLELRNTLAAEGFPKGGGVGFEIFDEKNFGATEFQQRVNYIRALQGELSRTISAIDGIEKARVHLVVPEKTLFSEDQKPPSATVAITLFKGRAISSSQISGIVHMVVTSVEGLADSHVNIVDQNGNILFKAAGGDGVKSLANLEMQRSVEQELEKQISSLLESIVGSGSYSVKASAELDLQVVERTIERVDPEGRVALTENEIKETSTGSQGSASGVPGTEGTLPGGDAGAGAGSSSESTKRSETTNTYAVSKTIERVVDPIGEIKKLSVAVVVDGNYQTAEDGTRTYQPRSEEEMQKLQQVVRGTMGFNEERGDTLRIENIQFKIIETEDVAQEEFVAATNSSRWSIFLMDNAKVLGMVLILGIIFFLIVKLINSYAPPVEVAYANIIGQSAGRVAQALPPRGQVNVIQRDSPEARAAADAVAQGNPELQKATSSGNEINFVETQEPSITVEKVKASEEKLRLQAAKMQTEALVMENLEESVAVVRGWLSE